MILSFWSTKKKVNTYHFFKHSYKILNLFVSHINYYSHFSFNLGRGGQKKLIMRTIDGQHEQ